MVGFKSTTAAPPPTSRFLEGSMNDRVSAVPPADFLGPDAMDEDDYEKKFALDWKPPDLELADGNPYMNNGNNSNNSFGNIPNPRTSFVSMRSGSYNGMPSSLTRIGTGASSSVWSKAPKQHGSSSTMSSAATGGGFFSRVGGKFGLTRSKSSFDVGEDEDEEQVGHEGANGNGAGLGSFIPPVFKHKRSESVNSGAATAFFKRDAEASERKSTAGGPRPFSTLAAAAAPPAPAALPPTAGPVLPGFDPTRRPTREEIAANYQSLLASGFFGTHAIQSTRFGAPGQRAQQSPPPPQQPPAEEPERAASFAQHEVEEADEQVQHASHPPSPERQPPPPPPPSRLAPPPPPPSMAMATDASTLSSSEAAIPVSPTVLFKPTTQSQQRPVSSERMPPPPTKRSQGKPDHKANLSFSAVPYSSTRPGMEPSMVDVRPFRPPPLSLGRFSMESSGRRSQDSVQRPLRGIKRPFASPWNGSQASFATSAANSLSDGTPRPSMDCQRNSGQYGNAFTSGIAEEDKPESGARKLVKKLRKSASRISIDLGNRRQVSVSRPAPALDALDSNDDEMMGMNDVQENTIINQAPIPAPSARTSMSSTVRRSFSWKFGKLGNKEPPATAATPNTTWSAGFVLNNTDINRAPTASFALHASEPLEQQGRQATNTTPTTNPFSNFSFSMNGGEDMDRGRHQPQDSHMKKRELRGRKLRKSVSPVKHSSPRMDLPQPPSPTRDTGMMDWQQPQSSPKRLHRSNRSRSRSPSNVIRVLHDPTHNQPHSGSTGGGGTPATITTSSSQCYFSVSAPNKPASRDAGAGAEDSSMEGVEFSFHFPGRMRPTSPSTNPAGGPLAVVPDTNRGMAVGGAGGFGSTTATTMATMKGNTPHYSGRWVDEEKEDMIF